MVVLVVVFLEEVHDCGGWLPLTAGFPLEVIRAVGGVVVGRLFVGLAAL